MAIDDLTAVVVALENDLFFAVRIQDVVRALGAEVEIVEDTEALWQAFSRWPDLVLLDLATDPRWEAVVRRAKSLPQTRSIPIVAFGSHVDTETLRAARAAGCNHAWARSRFMAELPELINQVAYPPQRAIEGCELPPPAALLQGIAQFNAGEYWECHETLEALWISEPGPIRDLYQGILQIGVAFHHLTRHNYPGAIKMLRRGLPRLRGFPAMCQGVPVAALEQSARAIHDRLNQLGPEHIAEFDLRTLPRIDIVMSPAS